MEQPLSDYTFWLGEDGDVAEIDRLRNKCDKQAMMLRRLMPDKYPGTAFICGQGGREDLNGMPERLFVCPAYGVDFHYVYTRGKTEGPGW